jgi:hypothetical protein
MMEPQVRGPAAVLSTHIPMSLCVDTRGMARRSPGQHPSINGRCWAGRRVKALTPVEYGMGAAWLLVWLLALILESATAPADELGTASNSADVWGGLVLLVGTSVPLLVCGSLLTYRGRWDLVGVLTLYVWALSVIWVYIAVIRDASPDHPGFSISSMGVFLVLAGIPLLIGITTMVMLGAWIGDVLRIRSARASERRRASGTQNLSEIP